MPSTWVDNLHRMRPLAKGWDGHAADPPSEAALAVAAAALSVLEDALGPPSRVAPSVRGGVGVIYRRGGRVVDAEAYNDGRLGVLFVDAPVDAMRCRLVRPDLESLRGLAREAGDHLAGGRPAAPEMTA